MGEPLLRKIAREVLGDEAAKRIWKRVEIIGDIAIIKKPLNWDNVDKLKLLGIELWRRIPYVKSVWLAVAPVEGIYRIRDMVHVAGVRKTETIYREHGCMFKVDITRVYISPRLGYEHKRIAELTSDGERVLNMYAGAGLFSIHIACRRNVEAVYSIDLNPYAFRYMVENARLNRVQDKVIPILGEAYATTMTLFPSTVDRVLMPLPEKALEHLPAAVKAIDHKGDIHVYLHINAMNSSDAKQKARESVAKRLRRLVSAFVFKGTRIVRTVGPREYQVAVDVYVAK